jgi:hypothetical protein
MAALEDGEANINKLWFLRYSFHKTSSAGGFIKKAMNS